jgi:hypothetical protein
MRVDGIQARRVEEVRVNWLLVSGVAGASASKGVVSMSSGSGSGPNDSGAVTVAAN